MKNFWIFTALLMVLLVPACGGGSEETPVSAVISGAEGGLYPPQDLSVIAATNRVQFLNVYANW